ncbi:hypothetical protein D9M68_832750 [compost metagenome]
MFDGITIRRTLRAKYAGICVSRALDCRDEMSCYHCFRQEANSPKVVAFPPPRERGSVVARQVKNPESEILLDCMMFEVFKQQML